MKLTKMKEFFKKNWQLLVIIVLALCFFFVSSSLIYYSQKDGFVKWSSPDETANYIFAKLYGQTGEIKFFEKYNLMADDIMHPRSFRSDHGDLKPISFLGIILIYGSIVKLTTYKVLPYLTPLFASIGIIFFYLLVKKLFGKKNAFLCALVLLSFPPFFYYTVRSMMHNVLFVVMLLVGIYFSILMNGKFNKWLQFFLSAVSGLFFGLALITRTSEALWIMPMLFIMWIFNVRKIGFTKLIIFLSFLILVFLPVLKWNSVLYGGAFRGGYTEMNNSIETIKSASADLVKTTVVGELGYHKYLLGKIKDSIFYFGIHPRQALRMFYYYFIIMFPLLFWPAVLGAILFLENFYKWKKKHFVYFFSLVLVSAILVLYYGSWEFYDNPDKASRTIGNSYTRYWLPVYLGAMPFFSMFLIKFTRALFNIKKKEEQVFDFEEKSKKSFFYTVKKGVGDFIDDFKKKKVKLFLASALQIVIIIFISFYSFTFLAYGSEEGLIYYFQKGDGVRYEFSRVMELTETNSVIITQYHDKLFFGERKVVVGLFDNKEMVKKYAKIAKHIPVYYYNFNLREIDLEYLNGKRLGEVGLGIELVERVNKDFSLYRIKLLDG